MTILESVREYIKTFPPLSEREINVDYLPGDAQSYSVDVVPSEEILRQYVDGSSIRQFSFMVAVRNTYGQTVRQQLDNIGFFEEFTKWLERNAENGIFPELTDGRVSRGIAVSASGHAFETSTDTARYQLQCRLEYFQPAA